MVSNSPSLVGIVASVLLVACAQLWGATARAKMSPLEELSNFDISDPELKEVLEQSAEGYKDAISRFYGSGHIASVVRQGAGKALPVEDVTMSVGDSWIVTATEMSLSAPSSMEATVKSMDLRFPNLALSLELGDVTVEGAFLAQGPGQESLQGKFTAEISGLTAGGRIGLRVSEDSLMPSMLDLDYNAADVSIKATTDSGVETTFDSEEIGAGVLRRLMERLSTPLNQHLTPIMAEAILEDSVEERLAGDEDTVALAKEHMDRASKLAVDVLSHLLRETTRADPGLALHELKLETDGGWVQVDRAVLQGAVMDVLGRAMIALVDGKVVVSGKIRLVPEKLEAVYSSSHVGAKMGRLVGNGGYSIFRVRVAVDANSAKPQLRVQRVALTQLRAPEITEATGPAALDRLVKAAVPALMETEGFVLKQRLDEGARL